MRIKIRRIGNSQAVVIPRPVLLQLGLSAESGAEMTILRDRLVLRKSAEAVRAGWAKAARKIADAGDDEPVVGCFENVGDAGLSW